MATIVQDLFNGSGNPIGRTPDQLTYDSNTWGQVGDNATFNVQSGYVGITGFGTGAVSGTRFNPLVIPCGTPDVAITAVVYDGSSGVINDGPGVCFRAQAADQMIVVRICAEDDIFLMEKCVTGGTRSTLDSEALSIASATNYTIIAVANGSSITAELRDSSNNLLASLSATETDFQTVETHGLIFGRAGGVTQRCLEVTIADAVSINSTVRPNGFDIIVDSSDGDAENYTIEAGAEGSETERTIAYIIGAGSGKKLIRLANGNRVLATDNVLVTSTSDGVTEEVATNRSVQAANKIVDRGLEIVFDGLTESNIGVLASGEVQYAGGVHPESVSFTPATGEEQYQFTAAMIEPSAGSGQVQAFYHDDTTYSASEFQYDSELAVEFPATLTEGQSILFGVAWADTEARANSTAYSLGDVIRSGATNYYRCTAAGTTAASPPSFTTGEVTDGTVTWNRAASNGYSNSNNSPLQRLTILHYAGSTLRDEDEFRPAYTAGATKYRFRIGDVNKALLPNLAATSGQETLANVTETVRYVWYETGLINGSVSTSPIENMGTGYGVHLQTRCSDLVQVLLSTVGQSDGATECLYLAIQRGIDLIGIREAGGSWTALEGWSIGRLILPLFTAIALDAIPELLPKIRRPDPEDPEWLGFSETEQAVYITLADHDKTMARGGHDYFDGNGGTWVDPSDAPSTYSDGPANAYFPASVRGTWLHAPEYNSRGIAGMDATETTPRWDEGNSYRLCCTNQYGGILEYLLHFAGLVHDEPLRALLDYQARYSLIEDGGFLLARYSAWRDEHLAGVRAAFAIVSAEAEGTTLTVRTNRYCTGTDAGWLAGLAIADGPTLSSPVHAGPWTWQFTLSAAIVGEKTLAYTAASGDAEDAEGNALGDQSIAIMGGTQSPATLVSVTAVGNTVQFKFSETVEWSVEFPPSYIAVVQAGNPLAQTATEPSGNGTDTVSIVVSPSITANDIGTATLDNSTGWLTTVSNDIPVASIVDEPVVYPITPSGNRSRDRFGLRNLRRR